MRSPSSVWSAIMRRCTTVVMMALSFQSNWWEMLKRASCRFELATATSLDGEWWGVAPFIQFRR